MGLSNRTESATRRDMSGSEREMTPRQREPRYWISGVVEGSDTEKHYVRGVNRACAMLGFRVERGEPRAIRVGRLVMSELYAVPIRTAVADVYNHPSECDRGCGCKDARSVPRTSDHVSRERFNAVLGKWIPEEIADAIDAELFDMNGTSETTGRREDVSSKASER